MNAGVSALESALANVFDAHPLAPVIRSAPCLGPLLGALVLAEIGDDPDRFATAANLRAFAGTAPLTRSWGKAHRLQARRIRNKRLTEACHWWAFAAITHFAGARAHYDRRRAVGDHHNAALRHLASTMLGKLWHCLQHSQTWNDEQAWQAPSSTPVWTAA